NPEPLARICDLGRRYPGPHENRRAQRGSDDGLALAIFVGARAGTSGVLGAGYPRRSSGAARISAQNTLYFDFGEYAAAMPMRVAPSSSMLALCGGDPRQLENASAKVW